MKTYVVGGAIRDRLLGLPGADRDHVVVGATVDEMLAAGFKAVGRDFPVFLHPETHEEFALARTERKVAPGYAGFVFHADPTVSLEADLERRDLTINAMAEDEADGRLTDPFGGQRDVAARLFRHVGPAFVEDPVRLLRVARFAARFADFAIAPETLALMRRMTADGEVDALVPERVWQEIARGLMEATPSRMIDVLRDTGALSRLLPEMEASLAAGTDLRTALDRAAAAGCSLAVRFAVLMQAVAPEAVEAACTRLAVPRAVRDVALLSVRERAGLVAADEADQASGSLALVRAMERGDAFRRRERFVEAVEAIACTIADVPARLAFNGLVERALMAATAVDAGAIARQAAGDPAVIAKHLHDARRAAVVDALRF